ncbi:MAG: glycosyltransferase [Pseudomonadota bacterium]
MRDSAEAVDNLSVVQVVASVEAEASGPSYSVPRLARALAGQGAEVALMTLGEPGEREVAGVRHTRFQQDFADFGPLGRLGVSAAMRQGLRRDADVFHAHGLWMMPNVYPASAARRLGRPFVLSPRGMLGPGALQFSRGLKRGFWALAQGRAARSAACLHATSDQEHDDIRAFGLTQPVAVIPNGIDVPARLGRVEQPYVLSLGRIHPKKGLDRLIRAWAQIEAGHPGWELRIVGPSERGHAEELQALVGEIGVGSATVSGPVFGAEKTRLMRQAALFVLPTLNENFAMTVAESLAQGTPVMSTKGAPWQGLAEERCGWWIDHGVEPLAAALTAALALPADERAAMGTRGAAWMRRDFSWDAIGRDVVRVYRWLCHGGDRPACVREDGR